MFIFLLLVETTCICGIALLQSILPTLVLVKYGSSKLYMYMALEIYVAVASYIALASYIAPACYMTLASYMYMAPAKNHKKKMYGFKTVLFLYFKRVRCGSL